MSELILDEERSKGEKKHYQPALLKVRGVSQYNSDQISFEGLDGFWQMSEWAMKDTQGNVPPIDTIAWFRLATAPKKSARAKPGSMYQDIMGVSKASDAEKEAYTAPQGHSVMSGGDYAAKELPQSASGEPRANIDPIQQRINLGMAYNNLTHMLAHNMFSTENRPNSEYDRMFQMWRHWFSETSRGLPLTPVPEDMDLGSEGEQPEDVEQLDF